MEKGTPFLTVGKDELKEAETLEAGEHVVCNACGEPHVVRSKKSKLCSFETMHCTKNKILFLVGVDGRLLSKFKKSPAIE